MEEKAFGKKGLIIIMIITAFLVMVIGFNVMRAKNKTTEKEITVEIVPVKVEPAKTIEMEQVLELTGNIEAQLEVDVFNKIPGKIIKELFVESGDRIKAGEKIAQLETDSIRAKMDQAKAALELASANSKQAETSLEVLIKDKTRLENLYKEKAVSRQQLDHMEAQVKNAFETKKLTRAQINQAEATLKELNIAYQDHTLEAPVSGYISKRYVDKGTMSAQGMPVVRISNEDVLKIVVSVSEKDFILIKKGMSVEIRVDAFPDKIINGTVTIISPTINPQTRTGEIEIHIKNSERILRAGMFAKVKLYLGKREALVVSRDALMKIPGTGDFFVYVAEGGRAVQKNLQTGTRQGEIIEVISGIKGGEQLIVTGQNRIREGVQISLEQ